MGIKHKQTKIDGQKGYASEWNDNHEIDGDVDFVNYELQNAALHNSATDPPAPSTGQIYFNTTDSDLKIYDGADWFTYFKGSNVYAKRCKNDGPYAIPGGWNVIPNLTDTHTYPAGVLQVTATINAATDNGVLGADGWLALRVDGTTKELKRMYLSFVDGFDEQNIFIFTGDWMQDLTAGSHTIDVRFLSTSNWVEITYAVLQILFIPT